MEGHVDSVEIKKHSHLQLLEDITLAVALLGDSPTILEVLHLLPRESILRFRDEAYSNPHYQQTGSDARSEWVGRCRVFDSEARKLTLNDYGKSLVEQVFERAPTDPDLRERLTHILDAIRIAESSRATS